MVHFIFFIFQLWLKMILKSHSLRHCSLMTDNDFQLQLITTLKKQTTTNSDHDNDLIILDSAIATAWTIQNPEFFCPDFKLNGGHLSRFQMVGLPDFRSHLKSRLARFSNPHSTLFFISHYNFYRKGCESR